MESAWQPIETAELEVPVLASFQGTPDYIIGKPVLTTEGIIWFDTYGFNPIDDSELLTHWMPLPNPPETVA